MKLERTAADRTVTDAGNQQETGRPRELRRIGGDAKTGIEARFEARIQFGKILFEAMTGSGRNRFFDREANHRGLYQPCDICHSRDERRALPLTQRFQDSQSQGVRSPVKLGTFREPCVGKVNPARHAIICLRSNEDESLFVERAQNTSDGIRIDTETRSQRANLAALGSNLPQQPSLTDRPGSAEEPIVQSPYRFGHGSVEVPDLRNSGRVHSSIIVRPLRY